MARSYHFCYLQSLLTRVLSSLCLLCFDLGSLGGLLPSCCSCPSPVMRHNCDRTPFSLRLSITREPSGTSSTSCWLSTSRGLYEPAEPRSWLLLLQEISDKVQHRSPYDSAPGCCSCNQCSQLTDSKNYGT